MGKPINPEEIPPEVSTGDNRPVAPIPVRTAPEIPTEEQETTPEEPKTPPEQEISPESQPDDSKKLETINMLTNRMNEYKKAALSAKKNGEMQKAIQFMKVGKQFQIVINAVAENQDVDLSAMPGPPDSSSEVVTNIPDPGPSHEQNSQKEENVTQTQEDSPEEELINPANLLDGLTQRMGVYKKQEENAKTEGELFLS